MPALSFAKADDFIDHILNQYFADILTVQENNYDEARFSPDGIDRSADSYTELHVAAFKALLRHSEEFWAAWRLLDDERSRRLYIDLIRYRLAGHRHVRLPVNTPDYWAKIREASAGITMRSPLQLQGQFGDLWHTELEFEGKRLRVDGMSLWPLLVRQYFYEQDGIRIRPEAGDYVIDAGAGFGDTALAFGCVAGAEGCVYSFELLDSHLKAYAYNLAQNETFSAFKMFGCGLSDKVFTPARTHGDAAHYDTGFALPPDNQDFPTVTLDHLVRQGEIKRVDFIKMDIEGSELRALHGAAETLKRYKPKLAISLYHDVAHFYAIPLYLDSLKLGYRFHLGHYTIHAGETVLYATAA